MRHPKTKTDAAFVIGLLVEASARGMDAWSAQCLEAIEVVKELAGGEVELDDKTRLGLEALQDYLGS